MHLVVWSLNVRCGEKRHSTNTLSYTHTNTHASHNWKSQRNVKYHPPSCVRSRAEKVKNVFGISSSACIPLRIRERTNKTRLFGNFNESSDKTTKATEQHNGIKPNRTKPIELNCICLLRLCNGTAIVRHLWNGKQQQPCCWHVCDAISIIVFLCERFALIRWRFFTFSLPNMQMEWVAFFWWARARGIVFCHILALLYRDFARSFHDFYISFVCRMCFLDAKDIAHHTNNASAQWWWSTRGEK